MDNLQSYSSSTGSTTTNGSSSGSLLAQTQDKIAYVYYKHGLICSRHPWVVMLVVLTIVAITCYPILGLNYFLGNSSAQQSFTTDFEAFNQILTQKNHDNENNIPRWV